MYLFQVQCWSIKPTYDVFLKLNSYIYVVYSAEKKLKEAAAREILVDVRRMSQQNKKLLTLKRENLDKKVTIPWPHDFLVMSLYYIIILINTQSPGF